MEKAKVEIRPLSSEGYVAPNIVSGKARQATAAAVVSILALLFGITMGWTSPVQSLLQSDGSPIGRLSDAEFSWMASLTLLGGMTGPFFWGRLADRLGRKVGCYLVCGSFLFGWGLIALTADQNLLLVARFINGVAGSGALIIGPAYISETAQSAIRGALGSMVMLSLNAGVVFAYTLGSLLSYQAFNFLCSAIPVIFFLLFLWMPESPEYLWNKKDTKATEASLHWLRNGNVKCVEEEIDSFARSVNDQGSANISALISTRGSRKALMIGFGLFSWQQFSGAVPILAYTTFIFAKSGSSIQPETATIIVGIIQLLASFISCSIVDSCGRKLLLLISYVFMGLSLLTLGTYFHLENSNSDVSSFRWVPILCLSVHLLNYALGAGPIPYIVTSETLPIDIKALGVSVVIWWGTLLAFLNVKFFPVFVDKVGLTPCLFSYGFLSLTGCLFVWSTVPETKGVPLHDILLRLNGVSKDEV
ncbi:facilitated trehalose transporter Tret1 [Halyomorpha halys]|uniref:facilitated trehalose transporter Tret1 n=1 Tax=Halyomorpha halys TaxID=286706 RepID=UPI0006D4D0BB|nr:facilitated trehalose transporter Tret1 [Halyomorpha halys]